MNNNNHYVNQLRNSHVRMGIKYGDNDFQDLWLALMETIVKANDENLRDTPLTKEATLYLINKLAYPFYLLFQNRFSYNHEEVGKDNQHLIEYFFIEPKYFYFGNELDEYMRDSDGDENGEMVIYDGHQIYTI